MAEEKDYKAMLDASDEYKLAVELGLVDVLSDTKDLDLVKKSIDDARVKLLSLDEEQKGKLSDEQKARYQEIQEKTEKEKSESSEKKGKIEGTLEVGAIPEEPALENDWIKEKREFWKKYATENSAQYNEEDKDNPSKTNLEFSLSKAEELQGSINYSAKDAVQISKDSNLLMYQGLVRDAVQNNLSITFGESLDEKQKLMLYAAVLMEETRYENGDKAEAVNPPKIDPTSKVFEELPNNVRDVLMAEYNRQQEEVNHQKSEQEARALQAKLDDVRGRLKKDNEEKNLSTDERYALRKEQLGAMKALYQTDPEKQISKDKEAVEKIMAARMGIIPEFKTEGGVTAKKDEKYTERKREQNPALETYLKDKFAKTNE